MKFMSIQETMVAFLKYKISARINDGTYKPKIDSFVKYLIVHKNIDERDDISTDLKAITYLDIRESMRFYIWTTRKGNSKEVTSKGNLGIYLTVVNEYFKFLQNNGIANEKLLAWFDLSESNKRSLESIINEVAHDEKLRDKSVMEPLSHDELRMLLRVCNHHINQFTVTKMFDGKKNTIYRSYVSSLICKLIFETGIKYRVIKTIKPEDFCVSTGRITLHKKYKIKLSKQLTYQLTKYLEVRMNVASEKLDEELFVHFYDELDPGVNTYVGVFLRKIGRNDTTGIGKTMIIKMMQNGIPEVIIKELTSYESSVIDDCKKRVQEYKEDYSLINELINNTL
ncbi:site-specific integrase [Paenibacillus assamensis]|uniref:site-specific integrase n=1 Tax=Paenibacillus assamensis TaxID=311244 RepID=UPI0004240419|nr:site-specific integrase [Paenibacillus assamensis]